LSDNRKALKGTVEEKDYNGSKGKVGGVSLEEIKPEVGPGLREKRATTRGWCWIDLKTALLSPSRVGADFDERAPHWHC